MTDAVAAVGVLLGLTRQHADLGQADPAELHAAQVAWHRSWAEGCDLRRRDEGRDPVDPRDFVWPLGPTTVPAAA